ncbi:MAG TPA: cyclic nucleotide-binding domain-containing protein [Thermoanaerobaculia bacterium]|nr:cyclic nucleotide-binding domain-containing protein [Thermoanaerobaculia bacterium]
MLGEGPGEHGALADFLARVEVDPWIGSLSFLLVSADDERAIEQYGRSRVAYFLEADELERSFARVLDVLLHCEEALAGAGVVEKMTALSGELVLETDLFLVQYYAGFFANYLHKQGYIGPSRRRGVQLALMELLVNAMEHGNAGITYEEKAEWLASNHTIQQLLERRMSTPPFAGRKVRLAYRISPASSWFEITDEGEGFDVSAVPAPGEGTALLAAHGRGILTSRCGVDRLEYNAKGNAVTVEIEHDAEGRVVPAGFVDSPPRTFAPGEVVFNEGDPAHSLYYIVNGEYDVVLNGTWIRTAGPADVFLGEMSFILGNRRSATVVARREGRLVQISRDAFTRAVQRYPSCAIFLCKLLARRLRDANQRYAEMVGLES